jgi:hypothetical protein
MGASQTINICDSDECTGKICADVSDTYNHVPESARVYLSSTEHDVMFCRTLYDLDNWENDSIMKLLTEEQLLELSRRQEMLFSQQRITANNMNMGLIEYQQLEMDAIALGKTPNDLRTTALDVVSHAEQAADVLGITLAEYTLLLNHKDSDIDVNALSISFVNHDGSLVPLLTGPDEPLMQYVEYLRDNSVEILSRSDGFVIYVKQYNQQEQSANTGGQYDFHRGFTLSSFLERFPETIGILTENPLENPFIDEDEKDSIARLVLK